MKTYTHKDIAKELGVRPGYLSDMRRFNPSLFPDGKKTNMGYAYTEKEKRDFIVGYNKYRMPDDIKEGLKSGKIMYQKDAAEYLGIGVTNFVKIKEIGENIPYTKFKRCKIFKKADLDEFIESGKEFIDSRRFERSKQRRERKLKEKIELRNKKVKSMITPYKGKPHKCCVPRCKNITTNRLMCNSCKEANLGCVGDL